MKKDFFISVGLGVTLYITYSRKKKKVLIEVYPNTMTDKPVTDARLHGLKNRVRIPFATYGA